MDTIWQNNVITIRTFLTRRQIAKLAFGKAALALSLPAAAQIANAKSVNVSDFGATGDGRTDDSNALNNAVAELRRRVTSVEGYPLTPQLLFEPKIYLVRSSINLTGFQAINFQLQGNGATLLGEFAGGAVLDALGSRWLAIRDLTIIGSAHQSPSVGLQIGLLADHKVADDHSLDNVKILGSFTLSCLYNRGAETTLFNHLFCWNNHSNSYCLIQDGLFHFHVNTNGVESNRITGEHNVSFNENTFVACDFRHTSRTGTPVWLGDTSRHSFRGCYAAGVGQACFVIYSGVNGHSMLDIDCHCETSMLAIAVLFDGRKTEATMKGFGFRDHGVFANEFVFGHTKSLGRIELEHLTLELGHFYSPKTLIFEDPGIWSVSGSAYITERQRWNTPSSFHGVIYEGNEIHALP